MKVHKSNLSHILSIGASFVAVLSLAIACSAPATQVPGTPEATDTPEATAPVRQPPLALAGTRWTLVSYRDNAGETANVRLNTEIAAEFTADQVVGNAGCNRYFASYQAAGDTITIGPVGSTRMACSEPEGIMEQEYAYLAALESAAAYEMGDNLMLKDADGVSIATFTVSADSDIVDVHWEWQHFSDTAGDNDVDVADPTKYTLTLHPDGTYTVKADCNVGSGGYTLEGNSLTLQPGPMTLAECEPGSLYDAFLAYLGDVVTFILDGDELVLNLKADAGNMIFAKGADKITDVTWQWTALIETEPAAQSVVPDPENYTLMLGADGTVDIKADCNIVGGSYVLEGDALTIELGPSTLAYCGDDSSDRQYLDLLVDVDGYAVEGGRLVLSLGADAGRLIFENAGPAAQP